jgi:hypothetical protein
MDKLNGVDNPIRDEFLQHFQSPNGYSTVVPTKSLMRILLIVRFFSASLLDDFNENSINIKVIKLLQYFYPNGQNDKCVANMEIPNFPFENTDNTAGRCLAFVPQIVAQELLDVVKMILFIKFKDEYNKSEKFVSDQKWMKDWRDLCPEQLVLNNIGDGKNFYDLFIFKLFKAFETAQVIVGGNYQKGLHNNYNNKVHHKTGHQNFLAKLGLQRYSERGNGQKKRKKLQNNMSSFVTAKKSKVSAK